MKTSIKIFSALLVVLSLSFFTSCDAQIKNAVKQEVHIYGNCGMCKKTIEKAGNKNKEAHVDWDKDTKMAIITFDKNQTDLSKILKRIAEAGYDNEQFTAPDKAYNALHGCCQYDRKTEE